MSNRYSLSKARHFHVVRVHKIRVYDITLQPSCLDYKEEIFLLLAATPALTRFSTHSLPSHFAPLTAFLLSELVEGNTPVNQPTWSSRINLANIEIHVTIGSCSILAIVEVPPAVAVRVGVSACPVRASHTHVGGTASLADALEVAHVRRPRVLPAPSSSDRASSVSIIAVLVEVLTALATAACTVHPVGGRFIARTTGGSLEAVDQRIAQLPGGRRVARAIRLHVLVGWDVHVGSRRTIRRHSISADSAHHLSPPSAVACHVAVQSVRG